MLTARFHRSAGLIGISGENVTREVLLRLTFHRRRGKSLAHRHDLHRINVLTLTCAGRAGDHLMNSVSYFFASEGGLQPAWSF